MKRIFVSVSSDMVFRNGPKQVLENALNMAWLQGACTHAVLSTNVVSSTNEGDQISGANVASIRVVHAGQELYPTMNPPSSVSPPWPAHKWKIAETCTWWRTCTCWARRRWPRWQPRPRRTTCVLCERGRRGLEGGRGGEGGCVGLCAVVLW